jgi:signal transduction histidine kinase
MPFQSIDDPVKLRRVLAATLLLETDLELPALLAHVISEARGLTDAHFGAIGILDDERATIAEFVTVGLDPGREEALGLRPTGLGVLGVLLHHPCTLRLAHLADHPASYGFPPGHPEVDSFLGVPVKVREEVYGGIYLTNAPDGRKFTTEDEALVEALAVAAGMAIENMWLHQRVRSLAVAADRERTARDLHDTVIQHLYAVGLNLETMAVEAESDATRLRLEALVCTVGDAIREVRSSIYDLDPPDGREGIRAGMQALVRSLRPVVGFDVGIVFDGPVDTVVSGVVAAQLLATVREAVTNIGRHASAQTAEVAITIDHGVCQLRVVDDGHGFDPDLTTPGGLGLDNMRRRAETLDGSCTIEPADAGGTVVTWRVPVSA